ncbi:MAG: hypothetical protein AAB663_00655 [Patescibacteria group bacterium]
MSTRPPRSPFMIVVVSDPPSTMKGVLEMHLGHIESAINALNGGACTCGHVHTAEDDARFDPTLLGLAIERYIARAELDKASAILQDLLGCSDADRAQLGFVNKAEVAITHLRAVKVLAWKPPVAPIVN